jgi:pimeloyl-ACP methyl ester carboxylesterase
MPVLGHRGYRTVAPDLRGYCAGARPDSVDAYVIGEFVADVLAIADTLAGPETAFHLMGTSIGATIAWHLAANHPGRVKTLACINIPHPGAFAEVYATSAAEEQQQKMSYMTNSRKEGNERATFERTLERMALPRTETDPFHLAFKSDEALRAVYHWYRAILIDPRRKKPPPAVTMPTMFLWPPGAGNVSRASAEANVNYTSGPYRFEILENALNFALQKEPERINGLLVEHLVQHDR